ncbi:LysR family transcriptional regulator [Nitrospira sp.]|nr:LysR family transcriptional regulator [Nitrospira sp.]
MGQTETYGALAGRILLALIFVMSGINKIATPEATQQYMASHGMTTATGLLYAGAIAVEIGAGLALLLGYHTRRAGLLLALFLVPTTLIFHTDFGDQNQFIHFLKNLAIMGGLLYVSVYGPGPMSVDAREQARQHSEAVEAGRG